MYSGYTYETGETWLPPLKRAVVDAGGHLRLGYWKGNDALQGSPLNVDLGKFRKVHPEEAQERLLRANSRPQTGSNSRPNRSAIPSLRTRRPHDGCRLGQHARLRPGRRPDRNDSGDLPRSPAGGFLRRALPGRKARRRHRDPAAQLRPDGDRQADPPERPRSFTAEDVIGPGCAAPAGIVPHTNHAFRLLVRKNMFELLSGRHARADLQHDPRARRHRRQPRGEWASSHKTDRASWRM